MSGITASVGSAMVSAALLLSDLSNLLCWTIWRCFPVAIHARLKASNSCMDWIMNVGSSRVDLHQYLDTVLVPTARFVDRFTRYWLIELPTPEGSDDYGWVPMLLLSVEQATHGLGSELSHSHNSHVAGIAATSAAWLPQIEDLLSPSSVRTHLSILLLGGQWS